MRNLQRGPMPVCLAKFNHGVNVWEDVLGDDKTEIWNALIAMQGNRCAYCECELFGYERHIEHFRQRERHAAGTFDWSNLFGSCNSAESCGKHKDSCGTYDPTSLIKADDENPDDFFVFVKDGTISIRIGLTAAAMLRAEETLRIFNLNSKTGRLRQMRRAAVLGHWHTIEEIFEFAAADPQNECGWRQLLEDEIRRAMTLPFSTAVRHALTNVL
jgi:uncharacterized protein (TIGR02646 family)